MKMLTREWIEKKRGEFYAKEENYKYADKSSLTKHVAAFGDLNEKGETTYSASTISNTLYQHGEPHSYAKALVISSFNQTHTSQCPFTQGFFSNKETKDYGPTLHLGTNRFYNRRGEFVKERWLAFAGESKYISQAQLLEYLATQTQTLAKQSDTGRNTDSWFSSETVQHLAGSEAWKEVFAILYHDESKEIPEVDALLLEEFFNDTPFCLYINKLLKQADYELEHDDQEEAGSRYGLS